MKIPQLSLFLENKPGHMMAPCKLLADAGISIVTLSMADTNQFGVLRLIVPEWQRAKDVLESAGLVVAVTNVLAIEVPDTPGGMVGLLEIFNSAGINIEYMYAFTSRLGNQAVMVFRFDDLDATIASLTRAGINPVSPVNLYDHHPEE